MTLVGDRGTGAGVSFERAVADTPAEMAEMVEPVEEAGERTVRERRAAAVAPLFAYLRDHGFNRAWIGRQIGRVAGVEFSSARLEQVKRGRGTVPPWFVPLVCQIIDRDMEEIMGAAWIAEFGDEFGVAWRPELATAEKAS